MMVILGDKKKKYNLPETSENRRKKRKILSKGSVDPKKFENSEKIKNGSRDLNALNNHFFPLKN